MIDELESIAYSPVIFAGASFEFSIQVDESIDLSLYSGRGSIRSDSKALASLVDYTVTKDAAEHLVMVKLTPAQTASLPTTGSSYQQVETYTHDVEIFTASGADVIRLVHGMVRVSPRNGGAS